MFLNLPTRADAGFFAILSNIFGVTDEAQTIEKTPSSATMSLLQAPLNPNLSTGGGDIKIVDNALVAEDGPLGIGESNREYSSDQISIYVVRKGDTLSQIAQMFDVSVNTIMWGNDLKNGVISEGQTLIILPVSGVRHVVKSGDTLQSIATRYKGDLEEILSYNNFTKNVKLAVGDVVIVPDGEIAKTAGSSSSPASRNSLRAYEGYYMRPVNGGAKSQGIHGYNGIDIAASFGSAILAAASGDVIISRNSGWNGGYGQYIVIRHKNGTQTLYAHLSKNLVSAGDYVEQGEIIGNMGSSGKSTGTHLHFEVRGARNPF